MNKNISLLDCTLRDGSLVNNGLFGENVIRDTIASLEHGKIDIIELGFFDTVSYTTDYTKFFNIQDVKRILPKEKKDSKYSVMALNIDLTHLEENDGTIDFIRLALKRTHLTEGLRQAEALEKKGYHCIINPVNFNVYTPSEYVEVIRQVNNLRPYGFTITDTFGVLSHEELKKVYQLVEENLDPTITLGIHLHENLGYASSLAKEFITISNPNRNLVIDSSIYGMGRAPGNLKTEFLAELLNEIGEKKYDVSYIYDALDDYIAPIKEQYQWDFDLAYYFTGKLRLHRTYGEYLANQKHFKSKDKLAILQKIEADKAELFDEDYIKQLCDQQV